MLMIVKNAARVIKHDQHCTQPLLPQKKRVPFFKNLADTRGTYLKGALIPGEVLIEDLWYSQVRVVKQ